MQYLVIWEIQGINMRDAGQPVMREVEAEDLSDLYNKLHDPDVYPNRWGWPHQIYEVAGRYTELTLMEAIHKEVTDKLK